MNNQKGFTLVELVIVIAILGIFGTAVFGLFSTGTRSFRDVGDDTDVQNEAQLTVNQIENLIIDATNAITYSYTAEGGSDVMIKSDNEIASGTNVVQKTLKIYNLAKNENDNTDRKEIYTITFNKNDKKITLFKSITYDSSHVEEASDEKTWEKSVDMADKVVDFSVSLDNAQSKNKVAIKIFFESTDGRKSFAVSKQVSLRNVLAINDTSNIYEETSEPSTVSGVQIFYDGNNCTEGTVGNFVHDEESVTFSFSALVEGTNLPSQLINWSISGQTSDMTSISTGGQLVLDKDDFSNTITVTATSRVDQNYSAWVNVEIKKITGINVVIENDTSGQYAYDQVIKVKADVNGVNLKPEDKIVTWTSTRATRLDTYPVDSNVQEYKIKALVGEQFEIKATSVSDSNVSSSVKGNVDDRYTVSIKWSWGADNKLLRNGMSGGLQATVSAKDENDNSYHTVYWEISSVKNVTSNTDMTSSLTAATVSNDEKIYVSSYEGSFTQICCGKKVDWNSEFNVAVRAYIVVDSQKIYSNPIEIGMDKVSVKVVNLSNNETYIVSGGNTYEPYIKEKSNAQAEYSYEQLGYAYGWLNIHTDDSDTIASLELKSWQSTFNYYVQELNDNNKDENSEILFELDGELIGKLCVEFEK